jgi:hypothetical protein
MIEPHQPLSLSIGETEYGAQCQRRQNVGQRSDLMAATIPS